MKITNGRAMATLRIQKRDDYKHIALSEKYRNRIRESSMFRRIMVKSIKKKVGVINEIVAEHLEAPNKGYPKEFKNYKTYDRKRKN